MWTSVSSLSFWNTRYRTLAWHESPMMRITHVSGDCSVGPELASDWMMTVKLLQTWRQSVVLFCTRRPSSMTNRQLMHPLKLPQVKLPHFCGGSKVHTYCIQHIIGNVIHCCHGNKHMHILNHHLCKFEWRINQLQCMYGEIHTSWPRHRRYIYSYSKADVTPSVPFCLCSPYRTLHQSHCWGHICIYHTYRYHAQNRGTVGGEGKGGEWGQGEAKNSDVHCMVHTAYCEQCRMQHEGKVGGGGDSMEDPAKLGGALNLK